MTTRPSHLVPRANHSPTVTTFPPPNAKKTMAMFAPDPTTKHLRTLPVAFTTTKPPPSSQTAPMTPTSRKTNATTAIEIRKNTTKVAKKAPSKAATKTVPKAPIKTARSTSKPARKAPIKSNGKPTKTPTRTTTKTPIKSAKKTPAKSAPKQSLVVSLSIPSWKPKPSFVITLQLPTWKKKHDWNKKVRSAYARPISRPVGNNYTVAIRALEYNLRAREIAAGKRVISIEHGFGGRDLVVVKEENLQSDCDSGTGVYEGHDEEELEEDMDSMEYDESSDLD